MKRIRNFKINLLCGESQSSEQHVGWHKTWDRCVEAMRDEAQDCQVFDSQQRSSPTVAWFCYRNMQAEQEEILETAGIVRWKTEVVPDANAEFYANYNQTDFGWAWVEGAKRDLPFRLSYFERKAERNPGGSLAFFMGLWAEVRDLFSAPRQS